MNNKQDTGQPAPKIFLAFLVAPLAVIPAICIAVAFTPYSGTGMALVYMLFGVPIAYIAVLVIGLPTHIVLCQIGKNNVLMHAVSGALVILVPFLLITLAEDGLNGIFAISWQTIGGLGMLMLCSIFVAASFGSVMAES